MANLKLKDLAPRPFREMFAPLCCDSNSSTLNQESKKLICSALRVSFLASGYYFTRKYELSLTQSLAFGTLLSIPAMALLGGGYSLALGSRFLFSAVKTSSLWDLNVGFAALAIGYYTLEQHDLFKVGFIDSYIRSFAKKMNSKL